MADRNTGYGAGHAASAPVVLVTCGDHRMHRSQDIAIIERAVDKLAEEFTLVDHGEKVEFDCLSTPGPVAILSRWDPNNELGDRDDSERAAMFRQAKMFLSLHGGELIVLVQHMDCGREGPPDNTDEQAMFRKLMTAVGLAGQVFREHYVAGLMVWIKDGRTVRAEGYNLDQLKEISSAF